MRSKISRGENAIRRAMVASENMMRHIAMDDAEYDPNAAHFNNYNDCVDYVRISIENSDEDPDDYDIDAIVDQAFDFVPDMLVWQERSGMTEDEYWDIVADNCFVD